MEGSSYIQNPESILIIGGIKYLLTGRYSNPRILLSTSLGSFITPFTSSVISFSVPEIGSAFHASFFAMVWVPMTYLIVISTTMILLGKLSDNFGRTRFYSIGLLIFGIGGISATFSTSVFYLSASIAVMGIGASFFAVNSTAILSSVYPPESRGGALGINAMSVYLGLTSGPVAAGYLINYMGWQSVFYLVSAYAFLSLIPVFLYLRKLDLPAKRERMDLAGFVLFFFSMLLTVLFLSLTEISGIFPAVYLLIAGMLLLAVFLLYERRKENPILDVRLFTRSRTFSAANFTAFLNYVSTFAIVFVFSIYFSVVANLQPSQYGIILSVEPAVMVIFSPLSGRLSDRIGSRIPASLGMLIISMAFFYIGYEIGHVPPAELVYPLAVIGLGFGLFSAPNTNSVMGSVERKDLGTASGVLGTMRFVGQLMSLAIMGTVLAESVPRSTMIQLFSGVSSNFTLFDMSGFMEGMKLVMITSGILSMAGVFTSLVRK